MTKTLEILLFCAAFLGQALLLSWFYARRVLRDRLYVLEHYPPTTHPRLYPQPLEYYQRKLRIFGQLNLVVLLVGMVIVVAVLGALAGLWDGGLFNPARDGQWAQYVVVPYFIAQCLGTQYLDWQLKHAFAMAKAPPPRMRSAELQRRRVADFVSPAVLAFILLLNAAFFGFILYYRSFQFAWFTAFWNIAFVSLMLAMLAAAILLALRSPRADPYQTSRDRDDRYRFYVQSMVVLCLATPLLVTSLLLIKLLQPGVLGPFITSLYCIGFAAAMVWPLYRRRVTDVDYDVYRQDATPGVTGGATG